MCFPLNILKELLSQSIEELRNLLGSAIAENLIYQIDKDHYQFVSVQFIEAIQHNLGSELKQKLHAQIAAKFKALYQELRDISIYNIAYHYNEALPAASSADIPQLIEVNVQAGREAPELGGL